MRTREEILKELSASYGEFPRPDKMLVATQIASLEVLLDIRDLLTPLEANGRKV